MHDGGVADSPMIGDKVCGDTLPNIKVSSGNEMVVRFKSDPSVKLEGYRIYLENSGIF